MKYIMIWPYGWFDYYMYQDLITSKKITPYPLKKPYKSKVVNFIRRVHQSRKINKLIKLPYKEIWYASLFKLIDQDTCVMFDTGALSMVSLDFLKKIKSTGNNTKMVIIIADSLHGSSEHIPRAIPNIFGFQWDAILSYDKNDCEEYGFQYLGATIYSKMNGIMPATNQSDLYFVGRNKAGRNEAVMELYKRCQENDVKTNFDLVDEPQNLKKMHLENQKGLNFHGKDLPYEKVISNILSTNCILEMVAKGQNVQTARYYETVCYNKKLLTNNPSIKELSFYNPKYMQYFENVEDIDFEWVKRRETIDYHYNNEFSPNHILEKLEKLFDNRD
jgi:hypothetical protein